jgi:hypothetical protein
MALVTRRTWPLIQTLNRIGIVVAAIALIAADAMHRDPCEGLKIGNDRTERVTVVWIAMQRLGVQHELPAFGPNRSS